MISHDVINEIYGDMTSFNPNHVILASTNKVVREINDVILNKLPG